MKPLLIHNDNTYLLKYFYDNSWFSEKLSLSEKSDIDFQLNAFINNNIANKDISVIFIKCTLSTNYLEFLGLRLGIHIRLSNKLPDIQKLPIVFLCEETLEELCRCYMYPEILYSKGVYITSEEFLNVQSYFELMYNGKLPGCDSNNALINRLNILPPANYLSHHSIANEWSILRWAKVLGISTDKEALKDVKNNIESLLYYKYLQAKYPIKAEPDKAAFKINGKGRILYIDDEWNKGWNEVLLNYFATSSTEIEFEALKYDFKDKSHPEILNECNKKIESFKPDVVLLDLRLSDSDFINSHNSTHLTGYKVLEAIKSINPGIQVIIFTASNKVWNFTELHKAGSDDFILKESPELSTDNEYSRNAIAKMASSISNAFKMSFLKKVYLKMAEIERQIPVANNEEEADFILRLKNNLNIAFKLLNETKVSVKYFNYAYLQLFQIIEDFSNLSFVFKESTDSYVCVNEKEVLVQQTLNGKWESAISFDGGKYRLAHKIVNTNPTEKIRRLDTNYKVSAILIFRLGFKNSSFLKWTDIYTNRNTKAAHFNVDDALNDEAVFILLDFIKNFVSPHKQKETNIGKGLTVKSFEESVELLKRRFKK
jgi:CheY-like chemotaxis protein